MTRTVTARRSLPRAPVPMSELQVMEGPPRPVRILPTTTARMESTTGGTDGGNIRDTYVWTVTIGNQAVDYFSLLSPFHSILSSLIPFFLPSPLLLLLPLLSLPSPLPLPLSPLFLPSSPLLFSPLFSSSSSPPFPQAL